MHEELKRELERMLDADQRVRREAMAAEKSRGRSSPEYQEVRKRGLEMDRTHIGRLVEIIEEHGWPGKSLVGTTASMGAFLILQHADSATQRKYLPMVREATAAGELDRSLLPLLEDRLLVADGKPQVYGTQITVGANGQPELWPLADPAHVDERRASVGLEPLAEYLRRFGLER